MIAIGISGEKRIGMERGEHALSDEGHGRMGRACEQQNAQVLPLNVAGIF